LVVVFITDPHFRQLSTNTSSDVSLTMEALHETERNYQRSTPSVT